MSRFISVTMMTHDHEAVPHRQTRRKAVIRSHFRKNRDPDDKQPILSPY